MGLLLLLTSTEPLSVVIGGTDYTDDVQANAFSLTECANRGEVGTGGFDVKDLTSALSIPALKAVTFTEPRAIANTRTFTGFTHERTTAYIPDADLAARSWAVETTDLNILAQDYVLADADSADRGVETDYARIVWLLTTVFGTTGVIGSGVVPNSNTVTMEATDYRGVPGGAARVLGECSEAAGKLWFIYDYGSGRKLYYDVATGTSLSSTSYISDVPGDPDGSTVWPPVGNVTVKRSPDRIYSKIHLRYNGGTVTVSDGAVATAYRAREASVQDMSIDNSTLAAAKANTLLTGAAAELSEIDGLNIIVPAANVNDIRQGQRVQIKLARHGISSYTYFRVIRRTVAPLGTTHYAVALGLASDVLASADGGRGADGGPQNRSNANDDGATGIIDRGGITVTDGAITVTNAGAVVIIDGTSNMFKVGATGTLEATAAAPGWSQTDTSVTLTGLGTLSEPPLHMSVIRDSGNTARLIGIRDLAGAGVQYVAPSSGGSPTNPAIITARDGRMFSTINGSNYGVITCSARNASATFDCVMTGRYHALLEASI